MFSLPLGCLHFHLTSLLKYSLIQHENILNGRWTEETLGHSKTRGQHLLAIRKARGLSPNFKKREKGRKFPIHGPSLTGLLM